MPQDFGSRFREGRGAFKVGEFDVAWGFHEQYRSYMEDRMAVAENESCAVFGVFDGHGGHELAQTCMVRVCAHVAEHGFELVQDVLDRVDFEFERDWINCADPLQNKNVGTTVTVVVLQKAAPYALKAAWLGDSRVCAFDGDVKKTWSTTDHDLNNVDEIKRVVARGGKIVGRGMHYGARVADAEDNPCLNMSRALGNQHLKPHVSKIVQIDALASTQGQTVLVASDGLWNCRFFDELYKNTAESLGEIVKSAYDDNVSYMMIKIPI